MVSRPREQIVITDRLDAVDRAALIPFLERCLTTDCSGRRFEFGHDGFGNIEIGGDVLNVIVIF